MMFHNASREQADLQRRVACICLESDMTKNEVRAAIDNWTSNGFAVVLSPEAWADRIINEWKRNQ